MKNGCGCGCKGGCGGCCGTKGGSSFVLKFSGITIADTGGTGTTAYLADRGLGAAAGGLTVLTEYPVSYSRQAKQLVTLLGGTLVGDATLTVNLLKNGVVAGSVAYGGANPLTGLRRSKFDVHLGPNDVYGLQIVTTGVIAGSLNLSAELAGKLST